MNKEELANLAASMANPRRCGGGDCIAGMSGYHMGGCFVPATLVDYHKETIDHWFSIHNHDTCIYLKSLIPQRKVVKVT